MNLLDRAKKILEEEELTFVAIKDKDIYKSSMKGIRPVMEKVTKDKKYFEGYYVADKVIGKSAAALLIRSGVNHIHGKLMSKNAKDLLEKYEVSYSYDKMVPYIINNKGDDVCPMEKSVLKIDDLEDCYIILKNKISELMAINR